MPPSPMALQWEVGLTAARTCLLPPTSSLHSAPDPGPWSTSLRRLFPSCGDPQGSHRHLLHTPLAVWAQLVTRSTHAWGGGACSVAFTPVKIEYMQAICTLELHAMRFLIVCTLVSIWHYVACPKEWMAWACLQVTSTACWEHTVFPSASQFQVLWNPCDSSISCPLSPISPCSLSHHPLT